MEKKTCQVLTACTKPKCKNCTFYKTKVELDESQKTANARLAELSGDAQAYISSKYYNGEMPWLEAGNK